MGPNRLLQHLRTVHQNSVYHCATVAQVRWLPAAGPTIPKPLNQGPSAHTDLKGTDRVMRGALERLLSLSLQFPHAWEEGESPVCLGYIPYFVLANLRGHLEGLEAEG